MRLFPRSKPFRFQHISVGGGHSLYVEQHGNPRGLPVLLLHGGPGAGISSTSLRLWSPARYHIVCFDQRGCGKSSFSKRLYANTTQHLVEDCELIRKKLEVKKWHVVAGGSWGSCLSLCYGASYPRAMRQLFLWSVFLGSAREIAHAFSATGAGMHHPESYAALTRVLGKGTPAAIIRSAYKAITTGTSQQKRKVASALLSHELSLFFFNTQKGAAVAKKICIHEEAIALAEIELHYFAHGCFLPKGGVLPRAIQRLKNMPITMCHGRYDALCPPTFAYELSQKLTRTQLNLVDASHANEGALKKCLLEKIQKLA